MAVQYHTHIFEIPVASDEEAAAAIISDKVVVPSNLATVLDSENQHFLQSGANAVERSVRDKLRDTLSVKDLDAVGDETADDTTAITNAVAEAVASGRDLFWPEGTYLTTASIASFHSVRHYGPGIVKRGANLFHVQPHGSQANSVYLAPTGNSVNDGLSASEPMATFQNAFDALKNYGPVLDGNWSVIAAPGTYDFSSGAQSFSTASVNRVIIRGPSVGGHPNVPTTIIDGAGGTSYYHGLRCTEGTYATLQDMKAIGFSGGTEGTRIGFLADIGSDVYTVNLHADGCSWAGIFATDATLRLSGGILENNQWGASLYHSRGTVGYSGSASSNRPIIRNNTEAGVVWTGIAMGHIDYCDIEDNPIGISLIYNSRAHVVGCDLKRNSYGIRVGSGATFLDDANEYNRGTADANDVDIDRRAYSTEAGEASLYYSELRTSFDRVVHTHTGTVSSTVVSTPFTIPAYRFTEVFQSLRVKVHGLCTSMTNGASLSLTFGGVSGQTLAFNGTPGAGAPFTAEFLVVPATSSSQRIFGTLRHNLSAARENNSSSSVDFTVDRDVQIAVTLANAADTIVINRVEVWLTG